MIPGKEYGGDMQSSYFLNGFTGFCTQCVGKHDKSCQLSVDSHVNDGASVRKIDFCFFSDLCIQVDSVEEFRISRMDGFSVNYSGNAFSRLHVEILDGKSFFSVAMDNCFPQGMLGHFFNGCGISVELRFGVRGKGFHRGDNGGSVS